MRMTMTKMMTMTMTIWIRIRTRIRIRIRIRIRNRIRIRMVAKGKVVSCNELTLGEGLASVPCFGKILPTMLLHLSFCLFMLVGVSLVLLKL